METTQSTTPVTDAQLTAFVALCQRTIDADHAARFPAETYPHMAAFRRVLSFERGQVWAKIIASDAGNPKSRSVFGFVKLENGDIHKAASWKKPATNFPRGNIHTITESTWVYSIG